MLAVTVRRFGRIENVAQEQVIGAMAQPRGRKILGKAVMTMGESSGDRNS